MLPNELSQESDLVAIDRLPAVAPRLRFRHNRSMPEMKAERKAFVSAVSTDFSPHRRGLCFRIARRQQQLCLMRLEHAGGLFAARPPQESHLRQPLLRQPEPLAVIDQDADRGSTPAPEYKQASLPQCPAQSGEIGRRGPFPLDAHLATRPFQLDDALR